MQTFTNTVRERYGNGEFCVWFKNPDKARTRNDSSILDVINATDFLVAGMISISHLVRSGTPQWSVNVEVVKFVPFEIFISKL